MGEKSTIELSSAAVRHLGKLLNDAADRHAARIVAALKVAPDTEPAPPCTELHGEPYVIYPPDGPKVGFIDDREQVRHIDASRVAEVPAGWRPLLFAPAVKR